MENWQKEVLRKNFPDLIRNIHCNTLLISHLFSLHILSDADVDKVDSRASSGKHDQAALLLQILTTRKTAYKMLAQSLYKCKQSGALFILLQGIEEHLPGQNPFQFCDIEIDITDVLATNVVFEDIQLPLQEICQPLNQGTVEALINESMNSSMYKTFLYKTEPKFVLARNTITNPIPYYINRSISQKTRLDPSVFHKLKNDVFAIEGIQLHQLTKLAKGINEKDNYHDLITNRKHRTHSASPIEVSKNIRTDTSSNQRHGVTVRFILLEDPSHFEDIQNNTVSVVHWIQFEGGHYYYRKAGQSNGLKRVKKYIDTKEVVLFSEDKFITMCLKSPRNYPILLYESPGMGKTILLGEFARQIKARSSTKNVVFISMTDFVNMFRQCREVSAKELKNILLERITVNKLGKEIQRELLNCDEHSVELFVDAFDEIDKSDVELSKKILLCIVNEVKNTRVFITTRPQYSTELEDMFGVPGYSILPFQESDQISFFVRYWQNTHNIHAAQESKDFAKLCLKSYTSAVCSRDQKLAGIPLQCRMLAELYSREAKNQRLKISKPVFLIKSIYHMFKEYIDLKFELVCDNDAHKCELYKYHLDCALQLLFPHKVKLLCSEISLDKIYAIGILEHNENNPIVPNFVHRTYAEFLAAEHIVLTVQSATIDNTFITFFIEDMLFVRTTFKMIQTYGKTFYQATLVRFFDIGMLECNLYNTSVPTLQRQLLDCDKSTSELLLDLLKASIASSSQNLFEFFLNLFLSCDNNCDWKDAVFHFTETLKNFTEASSEIPQQKIFENLRNINGMQEIVSFAAKLSTVELVQLASDFVHCITGKLFHEFSYSKNKEPVYFALRRGKYQIVEFLSHICGNEYLQNTNPLHTCLEQSVVNDHATVEEKIQVVKMLLDENPDLLNSLNSSGLPPLLVHKSNFELVKCLILEGADLFATTKNQQNIAHLTATYFTPDQFHQFVEVLLSRAPPILKQDKNTNRCNQYIYELFNSNDSSELQRTPISYAVKNIELHFDTLLLLKEGNVRMDSVNSDQDTILHYAAFGNRTLDFFKFLVLNKLCPTEHLNRQGNTFLHYLYDWEDEHYYDIVSFLASQGYTNIFNLGTFQTPIYSVIGHTKLSVKTLSLLQKHGVNINGQHCTLGGSLLRYAALRQMENVPPLLRLRADVMEDDGNTFLHKLAYTEKDAKFRNILNILVFEGQLHIISHRNYKKQLPIHIALRFMKDISVSTLDIFKRCNVDFNSTDNLSRSFLKSAVIGTKKISIIKHLIELNANVMIKDKTGDTFLHLMPLYYNSEDFAETVNFLRDQKLDSVFREVNDELELPMHIAVQKFDLDKNTLSTFLSAGIDINARDNAGWTLLMHSAMGRRSLDFLKLLIDNGANVRNQDLDGSTFAHLIAEYYNSDEYHDLMMFLVNNDMAYLFEIENIRKATPLHWAAEKVELHLSTLDLISQNITNWNLQIDENYDTFLYFAVSGKQSLSVLKYIIKLGASWSVKNKYNHNLAHYAASAGQLEVLVFFESLGCSIYEIDTDGDTILHHCAMEDDNSSKYEVLKYLIEKGIDINCVNKDGKTAFAIAKEKDSSDDKILNMLRPTTVHLVKGKEGNVKRTSFVNFSDKSKSDASSRNKANQSSYVTSAQRTKYFPTSSSKKEPQKPAQKLNSVAQKSTLTGQKPTPAGQKSTLVAQKPTPAGQKSTPAGQKSTPAGQKSTLVAQKSTIAAQKSTSVAPNLASVGQKSTTAAKTLTSVNRKVTPAASSSPSSRNQLSPT